MKALAYVPTIVLALVAPLTAATHDTGCVITSWQGPVSVIVSPVDGRSFYIIEDSPPGVPGGGLPGDGIWVYEESNGLGGIQRGGVGLTGSCLPPEPFCLLIGADPIIDETCGHGPDRLVVGVKLNIPPISN
jgi:hypothetical protein